MVFELPEWINVSVVSVPNKLRKKEQCANSTITFKKSFCWRSNEHNFCLRQVWKRVWKMRKFWSVLENLAAPPNHKFPGIPPPPPPRLPWIYEKPLQIHWSTPRMVKYHVGSLHRSLFFQPSVAFARVRYTLMFSLFYVYKITSFFPWNLLNIYLLALLHVYLNLSFD